MIGIIAATGFTGKLIAAELRKLGADFFIAGRNQASLEKLSAQLGGIAWRQLDVLQKETYKSLTDCKVIINCAGPFIDYGEPIVEEAVRRNCHYLDLTGEQAFIKMVFEKYDVPAKENQLALVPGCAFEYALGDAAGAEICEAFPDCRAVDVNMYTSAGTRRSIIRALSTPGFEYSQGALHKVLPGSRIGTVQIENKVYTSLSFPSGEALMLPKHCHLYEIQTFMSVDAPQFLVSALAKLGLPLVALLSDRLIKAIRSANYPTETQRLSTNFALRVGGQAKGIRHEVMLKGHDPYGLTAKIVSRVAMHLTQQRPRTCGAISPSMVAGFQFIKKTARDAGVKWSESL